ncbi:transposase, partial [Escherichia coli]|nr:transposase [Escherichia coli]
MFASVKELVGLPGMPGTEQGVRYSIRKYATSETSRRRKEGAKGFEYSIDCLPEVTQQALRERYALQLMTQKADESPAPVVAKARRSSAVVDAVEAYRGSPQLMVERLNALTENQRQVADARIAIVSEVLKIAQQPGFSCAKAIRFIVDRLSHSQLDERIVAMVEIANARKGNSRALSEITLKRWIAAFNKAQNAAERLLLLAPGKRQEIKAEDINWLPDFLAQYRQSNGRPMTEAYEDFVAEWQHRHADEPYMLDIMPSYDTIRRAMKKLPEVVKQKGRVTGSEYRQLEGFTRR